MKEATMSTASILIVDDHPIVREGLVRFIEQEPDLSVCGEAENFDDAMAAVERLRPTMVLVDLSLKGKPGMELIKELKNYYPSILVLVVSMHDELIWAERSLRAGACGYVMKQEKPSEVLNRIRQALAGEISLSETMSARLIRRATGRRVVETSTTIESLSDRELQVLQLIGEGMTNRQVAAVLHISQRTVDAHREHIKAKLRLSSGAELLRYAFQHAFGDS